MIKYTWTSGESKICLKILTHSLGFVHVNPEVKHENLILLTLTTVLLRYKNLPFNGQRIVKTNISGHVVGAMIFLSIL